MGHPMKIEIWSDIVCPWCLVGKRRLEQALARFEHRGEVELTWRSYELDPGAPRQRNVTQMQHLASKYRVGEEQARAMIARVAEAARQDGLELDLERARTGSTFDAHRLLQLARVQGSALQSALAERFFLATLTEGEAIGEPATLSRLAGEVGLDASEVSAVLASDRYAAEVRADEAEAAALGAGGVPFYVIDRKFGLSGAQPPELMLQALERAWAARSAGQKATGGGATG